MKNKAASHRTVPHPHTPKKKSRLGSLALSVAFGTGVGFLCFALLIFAFSCLCLAVSDPHSLTTPLSLAAIYLSALVAGFAALRYNRRQDALLCGLVSGVLFALALSLLMLFVRTPETDTSLKNALLLRLLALPSSLCGAFLGRLGKKFKRKKRF